MPAIYSSEVIKRALSDPNLAAEIVSLVARKSKSKKGKSKIKGGAIAGIVIAIIVAIIVIAIILLLLRRQKRKKQQQQIAAPPVNYA